MGTFKQAIDKFANGGDLGVFAKGYKSPSGRGWDRTLLTHLAKRLPRDQDLAAQLRQFVSTPASDDEAGSRIEQFGEMIKSKCGEGVLDRKKALPAFAPVVLSACWHAQDPHSWQPYNKTLLKKLKESDPEVCERHPAGETDAGRCLQFQRSLRELAANRGMALEELAREIFSGTSRAGRGEWRAEHPSYSLMNAAEEIFLGKGDLDRLHQQLKRKKNLVLQGPPGTGKTFIAQRLAWALTGERSRERIEFVQFHQSYGYEDFVRGFRPAREGGFEPRDGPFLAFRGEAHAERQEAEGEGRPAKPFVLIIDEINRGNLSRIFGELLMLIEADKRKEEWAVPLAYPPKDGGPAEKFHVPDNLYLIGTMNTADRSLAFVDYALRRRFAFGTIGPAFGEAKFRRHLADCGVPDPIRGRIVDRLLELNAVIEKDGDLGTGFRIGHSYFCDPPEDATNDWSAWNRDIVDYEIKPLLEEYWFDRPDRAAARVEALLAGN